MCAIVESDLSLSARSSFFFLPSSFFLLPPSSFLLPPSSFLLPPSSSFHFFIFPFFREAAEEWEGKERSKSKLKEGTELLEIVAQDPVSVQVDTLHGVFAVFAHFRSEVCMRLWKGPVSVGAFFFFLLSLSSSLTQNRALT